MRAILPTAGRYLLRRSSLQLVLPAIGLLGLLLFAGYRAVAVTSAPSDSFAALGRVALQPAETTNPQAPPIVVYPPPASVPPGVSICGPLFSATHVPTCRASGTTISGERGELASYALVINVAPSGAFPNYTRDISESQQVASGLFNVLGHAKFDGPLTAIQVIMLSDIQSRLSLQLLGGNTYRIEVDQKTAPVNFLYYLVGAASFIYTR
jgi:hypothetical protein